MLSAPQAVEAGLLKFEHKPQRTMNQSAFQCFSFFSLFKPITCQGRLFLTALANITVPNDQRFKTRVGDPGGFNNGKRGLTNLAIPVDVGISFASTSVEQGIEAQVGNIRQQSGNYHGLVSDTVGGLAFCSMFSTRESRELERVFSHRLSFAHLWASGWRRKIAGTRHLE